MNENKDRQSIFKNRYNNIGFNLKKKEKKLMRLIPLSVGSNIETLNRIEKDLIRDIRDIDEMLYKREGNMAYIYGYLFSVGMTKQLTRQFYSSLLIQSDAFEDGFYLWRLRENNQNYELVSTKLVNSPRHFPQKLLDKSIENLQIYEINKCDQSANRAKNRWNTSSNPNNITPVNKIIRFKTQIQPTHFLKKSHRKLSKQTSNNYEARRKLTEIKQVSEHSRSHSNPLQLQQQIKTRRSKYRELQLQKEDSIPSLQELNSMLKKQINLIGIWLPPSTCPQLMGVISIQIKQKSYNVRYCFIKKYYWYRHGLSRRLFDSILHWSSFQFDSIAQLAIVTNRETFNSIFSSLGWQLASWINDDKIKIVYNKL